MAERREGADGAVRLAVGLAAAAVVLAAVRAASAVLIPTLIALIITVVVAPAETLLLRRRWRPALAFAAVAGVVFLVIAGLVLLTYSSLSEFLNALPAYGSALDRLVVQVYDVFARLGVHLGALLPPPQPDRSLLPVIADETRSIIADVTGGWLLVTGITLYMLYEALTFKQKLASVLGDDSAGFKRVEKFGLELASSMRVFTVTNAIVATANAVVLLALDVPAALLWASLSFLLSYIPNVGFIISVIPPTVATLLHRGPIPALVVLVAFVLINGVVDEILYPRMVGTRLDIAPFWTLMSLVFWGWLLGVAGAILAVPLTMLAKLVFDSFDATRPLAVMLGHKNAARARKS